MKHIFIKGHKHSEETKRKIGIANKGRRHTREVCKKISISRIGKSSGMKGRRHTVVSKLKNSLWHKKPESILKFIGNLPKNLKGENSSRWIKDRNKLKIDRQKSYDTKYKYWMLEVKKRDNWKCKISSSDCNGRLESHHILNWKDYPNERYNINNGITLCHFHHPLKWEEEKLLIPTFQELVSQMN